MIHISKTSNGQYQVTDIAHNGEVLKHSEPIKTKQSVWVHIVACIRLYCASTTIKPYVQDDTGKVAVVYEVSWDGITGFKKKRSLKHPEKMHIIK